METIFLIFVVLVMLTALLIFWNRMKTRNLLLHSDHEKVLTLTESNFQQLTQNKLVLVDFWAGWCAPCQMMFPIINDLADELPENSEVGKVDISNQQLLARKFNINSIPTLILLKDGTEIERFTGVKSKEFLMSKIKSYNLA